MAWFYSKQPYTGYSVKFQNLQQERDTKKLLIGLESPRLINFETT